MKKLFKIATSSFLLIIISLFSHCQCWNSEPTIPAPIQIPHKVFYNLEVIDLEINDQEYLSFVFNGKELKLDEKSGLYMSDDLIVYHTKEGKWKATVIGVGGVESSLEIKSKDDSIKELHIKTTSEVFPYKDELGPEWPGLYNIGNTCFANSEYKLIARSSVFDKVLNQDKPKEIHTYLRNIVNGIRLAKRSALQEESVNRKVSEFLLDQLTIQSENIWNDRRQRSTGALLGDIARCISPITSRIIPAQDVEAVIADMEVRPSTNECLVLNNDKVTYEEFLITIFAGRKLEGVLNGKEIGYKDLLTAPRNLIFRSIEESDNFSGTIQVPIWDYNTKKQVAFKTYKPVALCVHSGSSTSSGHYVAFINFKKNGWFQHNDSRVTKIFKLPSSPEDTITLILYELQD